ncbi:MAG: FKBP-type peptidyl-prolyl cis-trans isomerase [Balneolaceae bacterium]|jgi:FKBP-type peptidyl-prolyl cis-trans isomerase|nr:FKBP-type peptidyl-prolyl cis-trans isomerase [Balneolaceae bacterium]
MKHATYLIFSIFFLMGCLSDTNTYNDQRDLDFLDEYRAEEGVQVTSSGLLYKVIEEGDGDKPGSSNHVIVRYEGESLDRTQRYNTDDRYDMIVPRDMERFSGLGEGVMLMNEGSTYEFVLPTELATSDGRVHIFELTLDSFLRDNQEQFLTSNAQHDDIVVTQSGLQYRVLQAGDGDTPHTSDVVNVHYKGTYTNGFVFDESTGNPVSFEVNGVIPGFSEGLQLMEVGSKFQFFVPPSLGYGNNAPQYGAVLIFEVELVSII